MADRDDTPRPREVDQLQELLDRVGEDEDRKDRLLQIAALDRETYTDLMDLYQRQAAQVVSKDVFYPYEAIPGTFRIGTDPDGQPIGLTHDQLNEHLLLVGMTGSGKTTFFYNLMDTCAAMDLPYMVFDFKNDYRHLAAEQDLLVINWRDFKFNPLQPPPGVQPGKWGEILADTFAHATDLLIGSESYFLEQLRLLYSLYDADTATEHWPSVFELRDLVAADEITKASPKFKYKERVASRLSMMTGFSGDIFDCSTGYPLADLLERNVIFELKEPNQYVTNFVVEALLTWIFYYRDAHSQRQELRHLIMFDEAKRVFDVNRGRQPASGYPPIDDLVGKVREFGEGLIVGDHEPSKLTDSLKANTNAKLWLTLGSGTDITEMARTFGLERDETDFTRTMEKGEALFKLADREPVPIHLPDYTVEKTLTEADIRARMENELAALESQARSRPDRFTEYLGIHEEDRTDDTAAVGEVAETLLASVIEAPFLSMAKRYDAIDVDSKKGTQAKNELLTLGLVREVEVATGTPGRNPKLLELTAEGRTVLEDRDYDVEDTGRRGIEHRYWQQQIADYYADRGFTTETEFSIGTQRIDVYAVQGNEAVAIEVARSPEHEVDNIKKCLDYDVNQVQVAYLEEHVKDRIESAVREDLGHIPGRVEFMPVSSFT
ncbi:DUF87 domain-containing protein [Natrinema sp. 1APR25-10V2]|uniref:helicase HerA domain-containing protein n=1 Tax=Natrinema sp. 1APR25-10V2 TaxID=2951081 RepID=UPI00287710A9|nr:DUF87 domain-containing protein [Natrinema sp. 1APR25-10V2]MDS0476800.1 DUF87 domain-containing protein [Natrinema sp. 1APR25-10V2]